MGQHEQANDVKPKKQSNVLPDPLEHVGQAPPQTTACAPRNVFCVYPNVIETMDGT